ncbi:hypothetical protein [Candidatus Williamhamiltonella defendens]|nr:hypothetical protein [Candidatus Hamiltonella defensa]
MMRYQKAGLLGMLLLSVALVLSGCKDKGEAFVGHWVEASDNEYPSELTVNYEDGIFHVDRKAFNSYEYKLIKLEGKSVSDTVLMINDEAGSMRLENGKIYYRNSEFVKN